MDIISLLHVHVLQFVHRNSCIVREGQSVGQLYLSGAACRQVLQTPLWCVWPT
jgi:hypothetical protein